MTKCGAPSSQKYTPWQNAEHLMHKKYCAHWWWNVKPLLAKNIPHDKMRNPSGTKNTVPIDDEMGSPLCIKNTVLIDDEMWSPLCAKNTVPIDDEMQSPF